MLREGLGLSLLERPCCREVTLREGLGLSLPLQSGDALMLAEDF